MQDRVWVFSAQRSPEASVRGKINRWSCKILVRLYRTALLHLPRLTLLKMILIDHRIRSELNTPTVIQGNRESAGREATAINHLFTSDAVSVCSLCSFSKENWCPWKQTWILNYNSWKKAANTSGPWVEETFQVVLILWLIPKHTNYMLTDKPGYRDYERKHNLNYFFHCF